MCKAMVYIHGKGGSAAEAERYAPFFPDHDIVGLDYEARTPWDAKEEFTAIFEDLREEYGSLILVANSIGANLAMAAGIGELVREAYFVSPIVDMERLILDMLSWAHVSEEELRERRTVSTDFGEDLSWEYLTYVRENPIRWDVPTKILYGSEDNLTSRATIEAFAQERGAGLTVMEGGEHWFHTEEQLRFLDEWLRGCTGAAGVEADAGRALPRVRTLFIDADACPVTREAVDAARRAKWPCVIAGDSGHNLLRHVRRDDPTEPTDGFWVRTLQVVPGKDSADFAIVCELEEGDVVVTQDFGLASMALGRGARAIGVRGKVYDQSTIDSLMLLRHAEQIERRKPRRDRGQMRANRHAPFSSEDRLRFVRNLRALLEG